MDQGTSRNKETNPREKANLLSIITFFYNYKILKKGKKQDLEENDVYRVLPDFEAGKLGDRLEEKWKKDCKTGNKLWTTLVKCFGLTYLIYTIIQLAFDTTMILCQPKVFSKFVAYFQPNQTDLTTFDAFLYAGAIGGLQLLNALYLHNFAQLVTEYSMKVRTAVSSLIFRKAMRISPVAFSEITIGKTVTLISKDIYAIDEALKFIKDMIIGFLQLSVVTYVLYQKVGNSAFPPIAVIILIIPVQLLCGKITLKVRLKTAKRTDERFRLTQEALSAIKIIKTYTWQHYFQHIIDTVRLLETDKLAIVYYVKALIGWLGAFTINIAFYILLVFYIAQGNVLQPETLYFVQQCLYALRTAIMVSIPMGICNTADLLAAFKRIQSFLNADEIPKRIPSQSKNIISKVYLNKVKVDIGKKDILKSVSLALDNGLILITGALGSGKSVLLKTILGEYPVNSGHLDVIGTISYAPEEPWVFPSTIRQNIIFAEPYNKQRYQEVLEACALSYDINRLENMDHTIIGDKGINLSKGQQARISLARAMYKDSDIYLLDDCLSSLDNNVSDHIFNHCIKGLLKDKICIFVTNKLNMIVQAGKSDILFIENGTTLTLEQQNGSLDKRITYYMDEEIQTYANKIRKSLINFNEKFTVEDKEFEETDELLMLNGNDNQFKENVYFEGKKSGKVLWSDYMTYFKLMGGVIMFIYLLVAFAAAQAALSYSEKLISVWVNLEPKLATYINQNLTHSTEYDEAQKSRIHYMILYTMLIVIAMVISLVRSYATFYLCLKAAKALHNRLIKALLQACMTFFDSHYIGNIINRLSKDLYVIDEYMPFLIFDFLRLIFSFIGVMVLVASVNWLLFIPGILLIIKLYFIQRIYLPTGRSLRRLEASSRSPIIGYLNSTLEGLSVIRSLEQQDKFQREFDRHQDLYTSAYYMNQTTMRFFSFLLDIIGGFFVIGILMKLIFFAEGETAGDVGLVVSQAMLLSGIFEYAIRRIADLENVMTSVERVLEYTNTKRENTSGIVHQDWPVKGSIQFSNVSLTYTECANRVLKNISFDVDGGNKVGIVGRTGAGKTSIVSALLRLYDFEGTITIDNEDIQSLSIEFLRSIVILIPQDPVLFSGSIRSNIDPFNKYMDEEIWEALERVHIKHVISNLYQEVDSSTSFYSSGEKQLICLARALILQSKIIILDEATANLDQETDLLLQQTIQDCFQHCTVIIIAHKLHSVMWCDKVLTMNDGSVVEFDEPRVLLRNKNSILYKMIREDNFETFVRLTHL